VHKTLVANGIGEMIASESVPPVSHSVNPLLPPHAVKQIYDGEV